MVKIKSRPYLTSSWLLLWPLIIWCFWTPIPFTFLKLAVLVSMTLLWVGAWALFPRGRRLCAIIVTLVLTISLWPSRPVDSAQLSRSYVAFLFRYQNTPYVWGGENARGIDCSGLIRRAMVDSLLSQGWKTRNPALWREAATIWWRDCSALEMKKGYSGRINQRFKTRRLNGLDTSQLQIGDLAVMGSGAHVLAFIGHNSWIQADPNLANGGNKVIVTEAPSESGWFGQGVVICRWKILDSHPSP